MAEPTSCIVGGDGGHAVPIGLHAAWNFGQWMIGEKETSGLWTVVTEDRFRESSQRVGVIGYLILVGLTTFAFWRWYQQSRADDRSPTSN